MADGGFDQAGSIGRPTIEFDVEQAAELLFEVRLPATQVATLMGVSRPTLYNRLRQEDLDIGTNRYTDISDEELEVVISQIIRSHPNAGEVYINGHLRGRSIFVQRRRLRAMMHLVDPEGIERRTTTTIVRRVYSVPCPNFLWHIDGAHKLIKWKLVVHAAIDGFSRTIVFLHCSSNNKALTVEKLFLNATVQYGWPLRVRTDYGGENVGVWDQMLHHWEPDRKPVIAGSSVHNNRVERLHRDVTEQVCCRFRDTFGAMEADGILDPSNDTDLFCLHFVFLPHINKLLNEFRNAHNNHQISTEQNLTPLQLFLLNQSQFSRYERSDDLSPGVSVTELRRCELPLVEVPPIFNPLSRLELFQLCMRMDVLSYSFDGLVEAFKIVAGFVEECLRRRM